MKRITYDIKGIIGVHSTAKALAKALGDFKTLKDTEIHLKINSAGGFISEGQKIVALLDKAKTAGAKVVAQVHKAYSMAAVIMTQAHSRWFSNNSVVMFHGALLPTFSVNEATSKAMHNFLTISNNGLANLLSRGTKRSYDAWRSDLAKSTDLWVDQSNAHEYGVDFELKDDSEFDSLESEGAEVQSPTVQNRQLWSLFDDAEDLESFAKQVHLNPLNSGDIEQLLMHRMKDKKLMSDDKYKFAPEFAEVLNVDALIKFNAGEAEQAALAKKQKDDEKEGSPSEAEVEPEEKTEKPKQDKKQDEDSKPVKKPAEGEEDEEDEEKEPAKEGEEEKKEPEEDEEGTEEDKKKRNPLKKAANSSSVSDLGVKSTDYTPKGSNALKQGSPCVSNDQDAGASFSTNSGNYTNQAPALDLKKVESVFACVNTWTAEEQARALALKCDVLAGKLSLTEAGKQLTLIRHPMAVVENKQQKTEKQRDMQNLETYISQAESPFLLATLLNTGAELIKDKQAAEKLKELSEPYLAGKPMATHADQPFDSFLDYLGTGDAKFAPDAMNARADARDNPTSFKDSFERFMTVTLTSLEKVPEDDPSNLFKVTVEPEGHAAGGLVNGAKKFVAKVPITHSLERLVHKNRPTNIVDVWGEYEVSGGQLGRSFQITDDDISNTFNLRRVTECLVDLVEAARRAPLALLQAELASLVTTLPATQKLTFTADEKVNQQKIADKLAEVLGTPAKLAVKLLGKDVTSEFERELNFNLAYGDKRIRYLLSGLWNADRLNGTINDPNPLKEFSFQWHWYPSGALGPEGDKKLFLIDTQVFGEYLRGRTKGYEMTQTKTDTGVQTWTVRVILQFLKKHPEGVFMIDLSGLTSLNLADHFKPIPVTIDGEVTTKAAAVATVGTSS